MSLVAWPLNEREAGVELVLIETSLPFLYVNEAVLMLIICSEVSIKTRSLQPHFHSKARQLSSQLQNGLLDSSNVFSRFLLQVTGHRSQVFVLLTQKVSQTLVKANLRPKQFLFKPN